MIDILVPNAHLIGLWLQIFATGAYCVYFIQCVRIVRQRACEGISHWIPLTCIVMFLIVVVDLAVEMERVYISFRVSGETGATPGDPAKFWANPTTTGSMIKNTITILLAIISDFIIVWRTYVIWQRNILVILGPVVLLLADIAVGILASWTLAQTSTRDVDTIIISEASMRFRDFFIVTFCINVLCAGLICWKIRATMSSLVGPGSTVGILLHRLFEVAVQTAAFYCAHLLAIIVTDSAGTNLFDCLPPVTALVFSMLIVRTRVETYPEPTKAMLTTMFTLSTGGRDTTLSSTPTMESQIDLERAVETDADFTIPRPIQRPCMPVPSPLPVPRN
ncbi:hypothetical protein C8Q76DRAFT_616742 [Earliella scabrosa]|nr:hypothetical protein C8Q76DRAFT_616742 [Earliella scabrosa]